MTSGELRFTISGGMIGADCLTCQLTEWRPTPRMVSSHVEAHCVTSGMLRMVHGMCLIISPLGETIDCPGHLLVVMGPISSGVTGTRGSGQRGTRLGTMSSHQFS